MNKNKPKFRFLILLNLLLFCNILFSQNVIDNCFTSATPAVGSDFISTANLANIYSADVLNWTGNLWTGGYSAANLTLQPPTDQVGCRAIFLGSGTTWTTGGEQVGLRLDGPLISGNTYSFNITSVSHGLGSDGSFSPSFYTNAVPSMTNAYLTGSLTPAGYNWTTNTFSFIASSQQNGHTWIILKTEANDSSGLINSFCINCNQTNSCSVAVNSQTICQGDSATITATPNPSGNYSYQWTVPNGFPNPGNVSSFSSNIAGNYGVTISNATCSANASGNITINSRPSATVNNPTICQGNFGLIAATATPVGNYSYQWTVPNGFPNPGNVSNFSSNIAGNYAVIVTSTTTNCSTIASGALTVNSTPLVSVNSPSICQGNSATITATQAQLGNYSYFWTVPNGFPNPGNVSSFSSNTAGIYAVTVTNTDTNCTTNASGIATINPASVVTVNSAVICQGDLATIVATPNSTGSYSFLWTVPNGFLNPGNVSSFNSDIAGNYSVTITNTVTNCNSANETGTVLVFPDFEFRVDKYCDQNNLILEIVPVNNSFTVDNSNFVWQVNSITTLESSNIMNLSSYLNSTPESDSLPINIAISITSNNGCTKADFIIVDTIFCGIQKGLSANNDGENDFFDLTLLGVDNLSIFNRYGNKVFEKRNYLNEWKGESADGDTLPDGVYFYLIEFKNNSAAKTGWVYLLREN